MQATPSTLAQRNGPSISGSVARKTYNITQADLASILPVSDEPNPRNSTSRVKRYNVADVKVLAANRRQRLQPLRLATGFAAPKGRQIMRSKAMTEFGLTAAQMNKLRPVKTLPNKYANATGPIRFYNRCDVKALAGSIAAGNVN
ncbi:hypothetical protein C8R46DRAFT_1085174 [Mycena filopes]|nr:hypothetical protein C8R46DRAFT_1085174 [Mycena filopes]